MSMQQSIDLNCDLGEYNDLNEGAKDETIMPFISSCNIACGAHAGNLKVIEQTVLSAKKNQVSIGAHPSFPDRVHFGRRLMHIPPVELRPILHDQIVMVKESACSQDQIMAHVKPHGALYNQAAIDLDLALVLAEVIAGIDTNILFYGLAHSMMAQAAKDMGLVFVAEGFADRVYTRARTLQPRGEPGAVIDNTEMMLQRVIELLQTGQIAAVSGEHVALEIDTLCVHGDHQHAEYTAQVLQQGLTTAGFKIKAPDATDLLRQQLSHNA